MAMRLSWMGVFWPGAALKRHESGSFGSHARHSRTCPDKVGQTDSDKREPRQPLKRLSTPSDAGGVDRGATDPK